MWAAFKGRLSRDQTWSCSIYDSSAVNMARIECLWNQELNSHPDNPSLFRVVWLFMKTRVLVACLIFFFCLSFGFVGATCLVRRLITFVEQPVGVPVTIGLSYALSLLVVEFARVLSYGGTWAVSYRTGIRVRGALLAFLYKKLINVRLLGKKTSGEIINIYANDGQRIFDAVSFAPLVLVGPLVLIGGMMYLVALIGLWSLLGVLVFFLFDLFQGYLFQFLLGKMMVKFRNSAISKTEKRVSLTGEIIRCIRIIKMNCWEESFQKTVEKLRHDEKVDLRKAGLAQSLTIAFGPIVPAVAATVTFLVVILSGNDLLASDAFSAITVFFVMVFGIRMIPYGSRYCAEAAVALRRIQELLLYPEYDSQIPVPQDNSIALQFQNSLFTWHSEGILLNGQQTLRVVLQQEELIAIYLFTVAKDQAAEVTTDCLVQDDDSQYRNFELQIDNLTIYKKELVGICGSVGSGKSALLDAISGHMFERCGTFRVAKKVAYVTQTPWIQNLNVQDNILFGSEMNLSRYNHVLDACELLEDLELMKAGDQTEIGERGVTVSGGQKARISLARALYLDAQIYLIDDVLSSVDYKVRNSIFEKAVKKMLHKKRTVLFVTSDVKLLSQCDRVIYLKDGKVAGIDRHESLLENCEAYSSFCQNDSHLDETMNANDTNGESFEIISDDNHISSSEADNGHVKSSSNLASVEHPVDAGSLGPSLGDMQTEPIVEEEENYGVAAVKWFVYRKYMQAAGTDLLWLFLSLTFLLNVLATIFSTVWLAQWLKNGRVETNVTVGENVVRKQSLVGSPLNGYYGSIYGFSIVFLGVSGLIKAFIFAHVTLNSASKLHNKMLRSVLRANLHFFDTTPSGRILNRFSKDMDEIDIKLPFSAEVCLQNGLTCICYLIMIAYVFPWFILPCIPLGCCFFLFVVCFRAGITNLKRVENVSRSPLFDRVNISLDGIRVIHSFNQTDRFLELVKKDLDGNSGSMFMYQSAMRWLAVWLDLTVVAITFTVAILMVLFVGRVSPAECGMALAFAMQMSGVFQFAVRTYTDLEAKMTSVERVAYYSNVSFIKSLSGILLTHHIEPEADVEGVSERKVVSNDWPSKGEIVFNDVKLRYALNLPLALDGVTFTINRKEKIGVVGRTGAGKSSICNAVYRFYSLTWGTITIDGLNIVDLPLQRLRRSLALVPQDPILFSGSVRFNLDPENEFTDDQIWKALEKAQVKDLIKSLNGELDCMIEEGGRNLSVGERQLLCMARAILRNVRILILDEATSSLDPNLDEKIRKCFSELDCTVIVIAHKLENVLKLDKVLYMDHAKIAEFGTVSEMLGRKESQFRQLLSEGRVATIQTDSSTNHDGIDSSLDEKNSSNVSHLYPRLEKDSGETSSETSEFERINKSGMQTNCTISERNDIEIDNISSSSNLTNE
uniref:ABC transmembrane type-1 domain-containing protein n=1 Tax=Syphacia muris TaxID=451379 RepID=A0A158R5R5_9BILA